MTTFRFTATSGDQSLPLEVKVDFRPGRQSQRARRIAVGQLLGLLDTDHATVEPTGEDQLKVQTPKGTWVIGEARGLAEGRGRL
jgi:hypothetical protein